MTAKRGTSADAEAPCIFSTLYNRDWAPYATVAAPGLETSWLSGGGFERQIRPRLPQAPASLGLSAAWAALASTQASLSTWLHLARGERRAPRSCTACTPRSGSPPHRRPGPTQHRRPESLRRSPRRRCRAWRPEQQTALFPGGLAPPFRVHREASRPAPALMDAGETGRRWAKRRPGPAGQERQSSSCYSCPIDRSNRSRSRPRGDLQHGGKTRNTSHLDGFGYQNTPCTALGRYT